MSLLRVATVIALALGLSACVQRSAIPQAATTGAGPGYWIGCTHRSYDLRASRFFNVETRKRTAVTLSSVGAYTLVSASGQNELTSGIVLIVPLYHQRKYVAPGKPIKMEFGFYDPDLKIAQTEDKLSRGDVPITLRECQDWVTGGP